MRYPGPVITRRDVVGAAAACAASPALTRTVWAREPNPAPATAASRIIVDASGRDSPIRTLAEALDLASRRSGGVTHIVLRAGLYREKLTVSVPGVVIEGDGPRSILTFDAAAGQYRPDGRTWGTGGSATLTLAAPNITLRNLTIRNEFDYIADQTAPTGGGAQAVALSVGAAADRSVIEKCGIEGYQDTLYLAGSTVLRNCRIAGTIDFIFGGAAALLEGCTIVSRFVPGSPIGYIAAPSTPATLANGLIFHRCDLRRERGVPDDSIFLGRPWRAGGNMALLGMAAFVDCWMDAHVRRAGWSSMAYSDPSGARRDLTPREARLSEYASRGPGAQRDPDGRFQAPIFRALTPVSILGWQR